MVCHRDLPFGEVGVVGDAEPGQPARHGHPVGKLKVAVIVLGGKIEVLSIVDSAVALRRPLDPRPKAVGVDLQGLIHPTAGTPPA